MRPVGSAIFGHYADVHGRKNAMFVAIVGVGISTAAFGVLPTIAQAGTIAPVIFPGPAAGSGRIRRWRRRLDPHHRHRIGVARIGAARCRV